MARARYTVPKKLRINVQFLESLTKTGVIKEDDKIPSFGSVPVEIDNSIETFEFDY